MLFFRSLVFFLTIFNQQGFVHAVDDYFFVGDLAQYTTNGVCLNLMNPVLKNYLTPL